MLPAQDPNEYFDVVTARGESTGIVKRRADVHRDGDWHRAVHIWVYGLDADGGFILLNQRGRNKDTWPLALDVTVGGHLGAGETAEDAFREVREEIGVHFDSARFEYLFQRTYSGGNTTSAMIDRELQDVFLVRDDRPLARYAPNFAELESLVKICVDDAVAMIAGKCEQCSAVALDAQTGVIDSITIAGRELKDRDTDDYFRYVISAIAKRLGVGS